MSMYHGLLLVSANRTPVENIRIIRLLEWLKDNDYVDAPSKIAPYDLERFRSEKSVEPRVFKVYKFDDIAKRADKSKIFSIDVPSRSVNKASALFHLFNLDRYDTSAWPQEYDVDNNVYSLSSISVNNYLSKTYSDELTEDQKFAILFRHELKLTDLLESPDDFKEIIWNRFQTSGFLAQLEEILGVKLEAKSYFG
jgi:hypothetical protein